MSWSSAARSEAAHFPSRRRVLRRSVRIDVVARRVLRGQSKWIQGQILRLIREESGLAEELSPMASELTAQVEAHLLAVPRPVDHALFGFRLERDGRFKGLRRSPRG